MRALGLRAPGCNGTVVVARRRGGAETDNKALQAKFELGLGVAKFLSKFKTYPRVKRPSVALLSNILLIKPCQSHTLVIIEQ